MTNVVQRVCLLCASEDGDGFTFSYLAGWLEVQVDPPLGPGCNTNTWLSHALHGKKSEGYPQLSEADVPVAPNYPKPGEKHYVVLGRAASGLVMLQYDSDSNTDNANQNGGHPPIKPNKDFLRVINVFGDVRLSSMKLSNRTLCVTLMRRSSAVGAALDHRSIFQWSSERPERMPQLARSSEGLWNFGQPAENDQSGASRHTRSWNLCRVAASCPAHIKTMSQGRTPLHITHTHTSYVFCRSGGQPDTFCTSESAQSAFWGAGAPKIMLDHLELLCMREVVGRARFPDGRRSCLRQRTGVGVASDLERRCWRGMSLWSR